MLSRTIIASLASAALACAPKVPCEKTATCQGNTEDRKGDRQADTEEDADAGQSAPTMNAAGKAGRGEPLDDPADDTLTEDDDEGRDAAVPSEADGGDGNDTLDPDPRGDNDDGRADTTALDGGLDGSALDAGAAAGLSPTILAFTASEESLPAGGGSVVLSWETKDAETLSLTAGDQPLIGDLSGQSITVTVSGSTTYTLRAESPAGTVEQTVTVLVSAQGVEVSQTAMSPAEGDSIYQVRADVDGNVLVAGRADPIGDEGYDAFAAVYAPSGGRLWRAVVGSSEDDYATSVTAASDGQVIIAGTTAGALAGDSEGGRDVFLAQYAADGNRQWRVQFGSSDQDSAEDVTRDADGNIIVAGDTYGQLDGANTGGSDAFVAKRTPGGNETWTRQLGSEEHERAYAVATDRAGNVLIAGYTMGALSAGQGGGTDAFVAKYSSGGNLVWVKHRGSPADERAYAVTADAEGNVFVAGYTKGVLGDESHGRVDAFVAKYAADGELLWTAQLGSDEDDYAHSVTAADDGSVYIGGMSSGPLPGSAQGETNPDGFSAYVAKCTAEGEVVWEKRIATGSSLTESSVTLDPDGFVLLPTYSSSGSDEITLVVLR